jgi:pilus assembly protein CpaD
MNSIGKPHGSGPVRIGFAVALGAALLLGGCKTAIFDDVTSSMPIDHRQRHPIVLKEGARTVDLFIGSNRGGLTASQRADVTAFATEWKSEATGGVIIDVPRGTRNARAANDALREVRAIFAAVGVPRGGVRVRHYKPQNPTELATIRINYSKIVAEAGPCGLWPHDLGPTYDSRGMENFEHWNFGCSAQRNLAAMVANPADLVQPRGESPAYTGRRTVAIDKYRKGESTVTQDQNADKGKISDVGK